MTKSNLSSKKLDRNRIADVLIIGAGPSGSVAAKHLAEAGIDVV